MKRLLKLLLIGVLTTFCRVIGQALISGGASAVPEPGIFSEKGLLPAGFVICGIATYSIIAALYLLIEKNLTGHRIIKGLKYSISCCAVWIAYLLEPLPHVNPIDTISGRIADGIALLVMGLLLGLFLSKDRPKPESTIKGKTSSWLDYFCITACFINGRLMLYFIFDIYSSFNTSNPQTILWTVLTGVVLSIVLLWYEKQIQAQGKIKKALLSGLGLFGANLLVLNFFMQSVFSPDIFDLILRTGVDVLAVTAGLLLLPVPIRARGSYRTALR